MINSQVRGTCRSMSLSLQVETARTSLKFTTMTTSGLLLSSRRLSSTQRTLNCTDGCTLNLLHKCAAIPNGSIIGSRFLLLVPLTLRTSMSMGMIGYVNLPMRKP